MPEFRTFKPEVPYAVTAVSFAVCFKYIQIFSVCLYKYCCIYRFCGIAAKPNGNRRLCNAPIAIEKKSALLQIFEVRI